MLWYMPNYFLSVFALSCVIKGCTVCIRNILNIQTINYYNSSMIKQMKLNKAFSYNDLYLF